MKKAGLVLFLVLTFFCASFVGAVTINVCPTCNYTTIQDAINNASSGNIINVSAGSYNENVIINKSISLLGAMAGIDARTRTGNETIINSNFVDGTIQIQADNVIIDGIKITNSNKSIHVTEDSDNVTVRNTYIENSAIDGINLWRAKTAFVEKNLIKNIGVSGITAGDDRGTSTTADDIKTKALIINNKIINSYLGITGYQSDSEILDNEIFNYSGQGAGIGGQFINTKIKNNTIKEYNLGAGIALQSYPNRTDNSKLEIKNNKIFNNFVGIFSYQSLSNKNIIINYNNIVNNFIDSYNNGTGILDATYNWWGDCSGPDNILGNVSYTPWLGICITNKTNVTCAFETKNVTLSADLTGEEIEDVWFSYTINGINYNKTAGYIGGNKYQIIIPLSYLVGGQNVTWNVYANDSIGNLYNSSWKTFYVRSKTKLSVNPSTPDGENGWYLQNPLFELINDDLAGNSYYQWDSTGKILYTGIFSTENAPNNQNITGGKVELNWMSDFGVLCGNETEQNKTFFIDLTNPLIKSINPKNNDIVYGLNTEISAYLEEKYQSNSGINASSIVMKINNTQVSPNIILVNSSRLDFNISHIPNLSEGWNNASVYVEDLAGRNSSLTWSFFVVSTGAKFNLSFYSPKNSIYDNKRIQFNISTIEEVENIEYINYNDRDVRWRTLCRNCNEYGFSKKLLKSLNEGENKIIIRATDSIGNQQNKSVSLIVETKKPLILKTYPKANSYTNGSEFYIKYTEDNLNKTELFWNGSKELNCSKGSNQECITSVNLSSHNGEQIEYWFKITDIINNTKESKKTKIKVDTKSPVINSVGYKIDFNRKKIELTINATEENLDKIQYRDLNQSNSKFNTLCRKLNEGICEKTVSFKGDIPNIQILALDKAGNSDVELTP